jgi:hypothetical protein
MPALFLLAALITVGLGLVLLACIISGVALCFVRRLKFLAPFLLFVPALAALGAGGGSWGLGFLAYKASPMSVLPFWGYVLGLPIGAGVGLVVGFGFAYPLSCRFRRTKGRGAGDAGRIPPAFQAPLPGAPNHGR